MVSVQVRGVDNVMANMIAGAQAVPREQMAGMQRATFYLKGRVVRNRFSGPTGAGSVSVRTGHARQSIQSDVRQVGNVTEGRVGSPVQYVGYLEEGARPYDIVPVKAKALRWMVGGVARFAARVHHPGLAARHMFRDEAQDQRPALVKILGYDVVARVVAVANGHR